MKLLLNPNDGQERAKTRLNTADRLGGLSVYEGYGLDTAQATHLYI